MVISDVQMASNMPPPEIKNQPITPTYSQQLDLTLFNPNDDHVEYQDVKHHSGTE
jgi:hypothetical protein